MEACRAGSRTGDEVTVVDVYGEAYTMYFDVTEVLRQSGSQ
jgi:hypothetical protein